MTIDVDLGRFDVDPTLADLVRRVARAHGVEVVTSADQMRLHPTPVGATAAFVRRRSIDIATEPGLATAAVARIPGARLHSASKATTMVRVDARVVAAHTDEVVDQVVRALRWRANGPQWTTGSLSPDAALVRSRAPRVCPLGHEVSANGACFCD